MDGSNTLSDAEMKLITINGQTIMLEGDFENLNMTNEFLNEMLMVSTSKVDINNECNVEVNDNSCINCVKEEDEATKLEISVQGENGELQTIQIGVEEAKALGLYSYGVKTEEGVNVWDQCAINGAGEEMVKNDEVKVNENEETETCKVKFHSVPVLSVSCLDREQGNLVAVNEISKLNEVTENSTDSYPLSASSKLDKLIKSVQEDNPESLPAIGHLEGFQIPTSEDEVLLPATVNAKMADGSYQTITLIPQVVNGTVTYTVHFSNVVKDFLDENISSRLNNQDNISECYNGVNPVKEEIADNDVNSINSLLGSVNSIKNNHVKSVFQENVQKSSANRTVFSGFMNSSPDETFLKLNKNNTSGTGNVLSLNYMVHDQLPIETKIDNIISENESVISKCKKVKYGKKVKTLDSEQSLHNLNKISKSNITKAKKVKFKNKGVKVANQELDKKLKLSLLKPNNGPRLDSFNEKELETRKISNTNSMPHMNLNGRLEYPNLRAIDETAAALPYLKVKSTNLIKQPYFNVLPYPKDKVIPVQKQVFPLNCDLQQAKNLISVQKFLETQKLQLKIQPLVTNGSKIINIRPKPNLSDECKVLNVSVSSTLTELNSQLEDKQFPQDSIQDGNHETQEVGSVKKGFEDNLDVNDVLLDDGKLNALKFLQPINPDCGSGGNDDGETETENNSDCSNKINGIFIKNNPEYFCQRFKDGKMDEHPLGSSENPIQLVQTGHTFHSRQPLSETQLRQIASILQKQKLDSPNIKKNSIFDPKTNTRIVYRVVYPEDVDLNDTDRTSLEGITKRKRGRHRGKTITDDDSQKSSQIPRGPGRPKKTAVSTVEEDVGEEEVEDTTPKKKIPRTRSGRLSRPPRYMDKDYNRLQNSDASEKTSNSNYDSDETFTAYHNGKKDTTLDATDKVTDIELDKNLLPGLGPQPRSKRNFKPENRCPTCQKIYLGHTRMMWHLNKFPDHCNVEKYKENYNRKRNETKARRAARRLNLCDVTNKIKQILISMPKDELTSLCGPILAEALTIWDFLLLRINLLKESRKDEVDAMLHELVMLLEKLTKIAEDIFLPVFTKEAEKDEDCVEIDRMEVAIALGLPVGFYKINNDNLSLLRVPVKANSPKPKENEKEETLKVEEMFLENGLEDSKGELFEEKSSDSWEKEKNEKKLEEEPFWLENKAEDGDGWHQPEEEDSSMKTLSTKFEPNLSTKILESSNDSIDDGKYEEPVQLIDLDSNSKDIEQSNSSGNMDESSDMVKDHPKMSEKEDEVEVSEEKTSPELWNENSTDKVSAELWNENSGREKWDETTDMVPAKSSAELWTNENSQMTGNGDKPSPHPWNENSNLTPSEKVDETNSVFLDSLLSVQNSNEFLSNSGEGFMAENMQLINDKERLKTTDSVESGTKEKNGWRNDRDEGNYMRVWNTGKNPSWQKEDSILSGSLQERMPGVRTTGRLTSTPESNGNMSFSIPNRRNSISDFTNINLEPTNLDIVLPPAKSLIKDCLKDEGSKYEIKGDDVSGSFLEGSNNFKVKTWETDAAKPNDFVSTNVNSEDLMKMALESLTSQHDVINVPSSSFDSAMGILNQSQEPGNLNLFTSSETDALDFNLPLPDHLLRSNFNSGTFQTTCASTFQTSESPAFLSQTNNIFETTGTLSNSMKFDQFEANYSDKKSKSLDEVMEFFDGKNSFNGYETCEGNGGSNFPFPSQSDHGSQYAVVEGDGRGAEGETGGRIETEESGGVRKSVSSDQRKKATTATRATKVRGVKKQNQKIPRITKVGKKVTKIKKSVDYPKTNTIESIINEALFDSCGSSVKSIQIEDSSPNGNSALPSRRENYSLPIIPESLDEVENLDFLNQD